MQLQFAEETVAQQIVTGAGPDTLHAIHSTGCGAAIWQRKLEPGFRAWIEALPGPLLPELRMTVDSLRVGEAVDCACDSFGVPEGAERAALQEDVTMLASLFSQLMDSPTIRLRLNAVSDNACRRFHMDNVPARLLCTYRGRGTEFAAPRIGSEPQLLTDMTTGDVAIVRGRMWPGSSEPGLLHRSPPIEGSGETRLLLVIDPVGALN
ncbi:DUF1826 domain-containing protein [Pseudoruegeria sp. HB172150]|uniref:DUF1826 domain-containing protein n=1 Tax=Pseudoruegeria sp. HB172150 TaxID=2721164 RepID=UPI001554A3A9|nr:DUF1826 domain-containing protein [Pseudoruegeria sp. HB172150]